jgi:HK97 family phage major capsid protein
MGIVELRRQRAAVLDAAQAIIDKALAEERALSDEEMRQVEDLKAKAEKLHSQEAMAESLEDMRALAAKPLENARSKAPNVNFGQRGDSEANAWKAYLQHGDRGGLRHLLRDGEEGGRPQIVLDVPSQRQTRMAIEQRVTDSTMNITTPGDGGNLVPTTLVGQIALRKNERMLAERLGCRRVPGVGTTVNYPYEAADPDVFATTSEQSDAHGNNYERAAFTTAQKAFTLVKYTRKVELTEEMLEDTGVDLMGFIADKIGREIALTHNGLLVTAVATSGTSLKTFASNSAIAAGELEQIIGNDVLGFYLESASDVHWLMRSTTHWAINAVTADARFYGTQLEGLLGHDVIYSTKVDAIGASKKSVFFGDWNYVGYREAPELRFIQDPYSVDGIVVLKYSFRACYGVLQAGAIGYGAHPA